MWLCPLLQFYAAGTPLVCSCAGGLRERVVEYDEETRSGAGVLFSSPTHSSLLRALQRAIALHADAEHYGCLRRNAYDSAADIAQTASYWQCELERLLVCQQPAWLHEGVLQDDGRPTGEV